MKFQGDINASNIISKTSLGAGLSDHISILGNGYLNITQGTWVGIRDTNLICNYQFTNTTHNINDQVNYRFSCSGGTYTFRILGHTNTDMGIATLLIDGVSIGTIDWYAASLTRNVLKDLSGVVLTAGNHILGMKAATKHASSTDYYLNLITISIWRTS